MVADYWYFIYSIRQLDTQNTVKSTVLDNDMNWFKTQRIGGIIMITGGFLEIIDGFGASVIMIGVVLLIIIVPIVYFVQLRHKV
ncbi:SdpI family protein [Leuconostoc sp. JNUCC 76]